MKAFSVFFDPQTKEVSDVQYGAEFGKLDAVAQIEIVESLMESLKEEFGEYLAIFSGPKPSDRNCTCKRTKDGDMEICDDCKSRDELFFKRIYKVAITTDQAAIVVDFLKIFEAAGQPPVVALKNALGVIEVHNMVGLE
jgi:hypothetical protein